MGGWRATAATGTCTIIVLFYKASDCELELTLEDVVSGGSILVLHKLLKQNELVLHQVE